MTLPNDTMVRPTPESIDQARKLNSPDKIKTLTKIQVQQYIQRFFEKFDVNSNLLKAVSRRFVNYNIDKSFDPATDPTQRKLQIARYFNELRGILPCILVVDSGVVANPQSIGQVAHVENIDGYWHGTYPVTKYVPLSILAGARDLEEIDDISSLISLMFNEMRNLAGGSFIAGNPKFGDNWGIYLPCGGVSLSAPSEVAIADDPTDRIWYVQASLDNVYFESSFTVKQKYPEFTELTPVSYLGFIQDHPTQSVTSQLFGTVTQTKYPTVGELYAPVVLIPSTIPVNQQILVMIQNWQPHFQVFVSNPNVATITTDLLLTPKRLGSVTIRVYDGSSAQPGHIVAEKTVQITNT